MKSIFSYDSKLIAALDTLANTMILTVLFILCCLPVITVGAAFTALFAACRAQTRGLSCFRAFFKSFKNNFLTATLVWLVLGLPLLLCVWCAWVVLINKLFVLALIMSIVGGVLLLVLLTMCLLFYSRFECSFRQLIKNGMVMILAFPIRSVLIAALAWAPVLCFFISPYYFQMLAMVWFCLYSGTAAGVTAGDRQCRRIKKV